MSVAAARYIANMAATPYWILPISHETILRDFGQQALKIVEAGPGGWTRHDENRETKYLNSPAWYYTEFQLAFYAATTRLGVQEPKFQDRRLKDQQIIDRFRQIDLAVWRRKKLEAADLAIWRKKQLEGAAEEEEEEDKSEEEEEEEEGAEEEEEGETGKVWRLLLLAFFITCVFYMGMFYSDYFRTDRIVGRGPKRGRLSTRLLAYVLQNIYGYF